MYTALSSQEIGPLPANRRAHPRVKLVCSAVVWMVHSFDEASEEPVDQDGEMHVVQIDSLSLGGLSFVSAQGVPVGSAIWVRVRLGSKTCQFKGVVRRVAPAVYAGRIRHRCGVQFAGSQQTAHAVAVVAAFIESARLRSVH